MSDPVKCNKVGCEAPATHGIKLCVPCIGESLARQKPMELFIGVLLCEEHARAMGPETFFADLPQGIYLAKPPPRNPVKPVFEHAARARDKTPDFDRAFVAPLALASGEWQEFEMKSKHGQPQGSA